jgi:hypothetical protein
MKNTDDPSVRDADVRGRGREMKAQEQQGEQQTEDVIRLGPRSDGAPEGD